MSLVLGFLLLCMSWLQPLHIFPWLSWHSEQLAFAAVLAMGWETVYLATRQRHPSAGELAVPLGAVLLLFLTALVVVQWATGLLHFGGDAIVFAGYMGLCILGLSIGFTATRGATSLLLGLAYSLVAGAVLSSFIALVQAFEVWESIGWIHRSLHSRRPGANLGQPNQLATLLLMGAVSVAYLSECRKIGGWIAGLLLGVLVIALAATESKSGVLGFLLVVTWWITSKRSVSFRAPALTIAICGVAYAGLFWSWPGLMQEVFQYKTDITAFSSPTVLNRWVIWPQLVEAATLRPWFGWGFGQVATAHNAVVHAYPKSEIYVHAHSIVLDFILGIGLPLTIALVAGLVAWIWRRVFAVQHVHQWYCLAVVMPVAAHSLVEYPFAYAYFLLPVMLAIGAFEQLSGVKPVLSVGIKSQVMGLTLATVACCYAGAEYIAIEDDFRVARFQALRVGKVPENYQRPRIDLYTQLGALLDGMRIVPRPNMGPGEMETARLAALHYPMIATQNRYALSLALNGNSEEAIRQLAVMRSQQAPATYARVKAAWADMTAQQYPQLRDLQLPP